MLVFTPVVLLLAGLLLARIAKARRVWRRHGHFPVWAALIVLVPYTLLSLGLLLSSPGPARTVAHLGIEAPTAWFVGSGLFATRTTWPIEDTGLMVWVIVSFMLYPFWFWLGVNAGFWAFGRSPKQTGILGLLR